ncbi:MAG TPA: cation transporter [Candidatus Saccharimonadales bacterium]|nr:cation transporter [Candidatus Saccharimonadales bacterium]
MISSATVENGKISGLLPVIAAFFGNATVCIAKFVGFALTGSGAMFSEAIHSFADTANQSLLIIGVKKTQKKPNRLFPYGFGRERFIWALISACGIFFIGSGITVYHGIEALINKPEIHYSAWNLYILVGALIIESFTFWLAVKDIHKHFPDQKWKVIFKKADPTTLAVVYEDGLAIIGIFLAAFSIILTRITGQLFWDAFGSIAIGLSLGVAAIVLISKNRKFLLTRAIPAETEVLVLEILNSDPTIEKVLDFKSAVLDVDKYLIKCDVEFNASALMTEFNQHHFLENEYEGVKESYENFLKFSVDYMDRVPRLVGRKIDEIEKKIRIQVPEAVFIDMEIN